MREVKPCPNCEGTNLYICRAAAAGGAQPKLLPGLGQFLHYAKLDVVLCADCGMTRFFAEASACEKVASQPQWKKLGEKRTRGR